MVTIWRTDQPQPNSSALQEWIYNGLDSCVTLEVLQAIRPQLNEITSKVYDFSRSLQAPILEMMLRGIRVDTESRAGVTEFYQKQYDFVRESFDEIVTQGLGIPAINPGSYQQKQMLLYETLGLPPVRSRGKITTDRKALERLRSNFFAEPICNHLLALADIQKKLGFLRTGIDGDGRIRTSFNIAGTDTGRLSSYKSAFGSGTNLQNVTGELRKIFIADPGYKLGYVDLEQAEARAVGAIIWNLFLDGTYLDFCESGDLHTNICKIVWNELPWTGDPKKDKAVASAKFYREFSYRDTAKRVGHASNYHGQPPHIAKEVHIPFPLVTEFQRNYFRSFPGITHWHQWVRQKLIRDGWITTFLGRQRWFFGRRWEDETLRAAIAYEPQSVIADYINQGMLTVWRTGLVQLLAQVHDAILFQYPEDRETEIIPLIQKCLEIPITTRDGREFKIPTEAKVGWNWGEWKEDNLDGLVKFTGSDRRQKSKKVQFLARKFS